MVGFILPANSATGGYEISNSLRCDIDSSGTLTKTNSGAGNQRTWTFSCWVKRSVLRSSGARTIFGTTDGESDSLRFQSDGLNFFNNGTADSNLSTNRLFRDVSAWYHIVLAFDTTQGTAANRVKLYINGSQYTWDNATTYPDENYQGQINDASNIQSLNKAHNAAELAGYIAEVHLTDGTAYAASDFGETNDNGVWVPKKASVSYGTNGYYFEFKQTGTSADASGMGADTSGNTNHYTVANFTATDVTTDTPTNNFCTLNPLHNFRNDPTYSEGNTKVVFADGGNGASPLSTFAVNSGKWYWEAKFVQTSDPGHGAIAVGIVDANQYNVDSGADEYFDRFDFGFSYNTDGKKKSNNSDANFGDEFNNGDIIGVAVDFDNSQIYFSKNGTFQDSGDPTSGASGTGSAFNFAAGTYYFAVYAYQDENSWEVNFGNPPHTISSGNSDADGHGNFEFAVPSGYFALCTKNLAEYG